VVGQTAAAPTQPAYAGRVRPSWESQEGWDAQLAKPWPPPQPYQLMLEGYGLPGNPRKVEMCDWPNTGQTAAAPTQLGKGTVLLNILGRLGHAAGHCHSTQPDRLMWKGVAFLAIPGRPCWVEFMRAGMWSVGMSMPLTTTDPTNCWKSS